MIAREIDVLQITVELEGRRVYDLDAILLQHYPLYAGIQRDRYDVQIGAHAGDHQGVVVAGAAVWTESPCFGRAEGEQTDQDEQLENADHGETTPRRLQMIRREESLISLTDDGNSESGIYYLTRNKCSGDRMRKLERARAASISRIQRYRRPSREIGVACAGWADGVPNLRRFYDGSVELFYRETGTAEEQRTTRSFILPRS